MVLEFLSDTAIRKFTTVLTGETVRPTFSGQTFFKEITANTTFSFATTGLSAEPAELFDFRIILRLVGGTVLFPGTWIWAGGEEPTVNAAGYYVIYVCTPDGGENWLAALEQTFVTPANWRFVESLLDDGSNGTLRKVINDAAAGDIIKFGRGVTGTIVLTQGPITLGKVLTIDGGNKIEVSGNTTSRIFQTAVSGCIIENIVLKNGKVSGSGPAGSGGAIYAEDAITLESVTIKDCSATQGGAIYTEADLTLNNCTIEGNTAPNGAGVMVEGNLTVTLSGCLIKNNSATTNGGGLYKVGTTSLPTVVVKDCTFQGNSAETGAAIYLQRHSDLSVADSKFIDNSASARAAAMYLNGYTTQPSSNVIRCLFTGNSGVATTDGLIYATTVPTGLFSDCVFTGNTFQATSGYHRCIYVTTSASACTVRNCTFTNNDRGGGFYAAAGTLNVYNSVDVGNSYLSASSASATLNASKNMSDLGTWSDIAYNSSLPLFDTDNYTPVASSQVINKGDNTKTDSLVDFNGKSRIVNTTIDLGAVEYQG